MSDLVKAIRKLNILVPHPILPNARDIYQADADLSIAFGEPDVFRAICDEMIEMIEAWRDEENREARVTCVASMGAGIPLAAGIAHATDWKLTYLRKKSDKALSRPQICGYHPGEGDVIAIVDDKLRSGLTARDIKQFYGNSGADFAGLYVVMKRGDPQVFVEDKCLFTFRDLLSPKQRAILDESS